MILGLVGLATSCARSFALSYSFAFILFFAIIIQAILAILIVFFRYSKPPQTKNFVTVSFGGWGGGMLDLFGI